MSDKKWYMRKSPDWSKLSDRQRKWSFVLLFCIVMMLMSAPLAQMIVRADDPGEYKYEKTIDIESDHQFDLDSPGESSKSEVDFGEDHPENESFDRSNVDELKVEMSPEEIQYSPETKTISDTDTLNAFPDSNNYTVETEDGLNADELGLDMNIDGSSWDNHIIDNFKDVVDLENSTDIKGEVKGEISDWEDLDNMRNNKGGNYYLANNLNSSTNGYDQYASSNANDGDGWNPIDNFEGVFHGGGYVIRGLHIDRSDSWYVGLFGEISGAEIKNVGLEDVDVSGDDRVGGLVGQIWDSEVSNSYSTGNVSGNDRVGGLVGYNRDSSTVSNSYATGTVSGDSPVGGLVGYNQNSEVSNSYSTGDVSGDGNVGGLVGWNYDSAKVQNSYSTVDVSGEGNNVGGLLGYNRDSTVSNSYSTVDVSGDGDVGGLVGRVFNLEGETDEILYSYANSDINTDLDLIGSTSIDGTLDTTGSSLKTTSEMTDYENDYPDAYEGWDFDTTWKATDWNEDQEGNSGYPALEWEKKGFEISTLQGLQDINNDLDGDYYLGNDIDASDTSDWNDGKGFEPIGEDYDNPFTGSFDGQGHTISDLYIDRSDERYIGLFGYTDGSTIENVGLENIDVSGNRDAGGLVGYNYDAEVSNSYATGNVSGEDNTGGLVGYNRDLSTVSNCYARGIVSGDDYVGGLVGYNYDAEVSNSYATGNVSGDYNVGGLVGFNFDSDYDAEVSNSYSTGTVSGEGNVGGLVGNNLDIVSNSYWNTETSDQSTSDGGTGLTTSEMTDYNNDYPQMDDGSGNDFASAPWEDPPVSYNEDQVGNSGYPELAVVEVVEVVDPDERIFFAESDNAELVTEYFTTNITDDGYEVIFTVDDYEFNGLGTVYVQNEGEGTQPIDGAELKGNWRYVIDIPYGYGSELSQDAPVTWTSWESTNHDFLRERKLYKNDTATNLDGATLEVREDSSESWGSWPGDPADYSSLETKISADGTTTHEDPSNDLRVVDWNWNGTMLAVGATGGNVYIYDDSYNLQHSFVAPSDAGYSVTDLEFDPLTNYLLVSCGDGDFYVYDVTDWSLVNSQNIGSQAESVTWLGNNGLAAGNRNGDIYIYTFDGSSFTHMDTMSQHSDAISTLDNYGNPDFDDDVKIVAGSYDTDISIYDQTGMWTFGLQDKSSSPDDNVLDVRFESSGGQVFVSSSDNNLRRYSIDSSVNFNLEDTWSFGSDVSNALIKDGYLFIGTGQSIEIWDAWGSWGYVDTVSVGADVRYIDVKPYSDTSFSVAVDNMDGILYEVGRRRDAYVKFDFEDPSGGYVENVNSAFKDSADLSIGGDNYHFIDDGSYESKTIFGDFDTVEMQNRLDEPVGIDFNMDANYPLYKNESVDYLDIEVRLYDDSDNVVENVTVREVYGETNVLKYLPDDNQDILNQTDYLTIEVLDRDNYSQEGIKYNGLTTTVTLTYEDPDQPGGATFLNFSTDPTFIFFFVMIAMAMIVGGFTGSLEMGSFVFLILSGVGMMLGWVHFALFLLLVVMFAVVYAVKNKWKS